MCAFRYTPDGETSIHREGAIRHLIATMQSHENGLPEWAKNSADAYVRIDTTPQMRVVVLIFNHGHSARPSSVGCLDFIGMSSRDIEQYFRVWADPNAARAGTSVTDLQGGHGNGGKAYMVQMFQDYSMLYTVKEEKGCKYGVPGDSVQFGYVPDQTKGRDFPVRNLWDALNAALAEMDLKYEALPTAAKQSFENGEGFTFVRGVNPRDYGPTIPVRQLLERIVNHHQMVRTLELCEVYVIVNGRLYNKGRPLALPHIPPLEGAEEPREITIPDSLIDPLSEREVSTTEGGRYPTGKLILRTSNTDMRYGPRRYRHNIRLIAGPGLIGIVEMTDLIRSPYGNKIYGECMLEALERYKTNDRTRIADSPLTKALKEWLRQQVEEYAQQFETRDQRRYSQDERNALSEMNSALDQWKNQFLDRVISGLVGESEVGVPPPPPPLPIGTPRRIDLDISHRLAGVGVAFRPLVKFFDADGRRIRPVPFRWVSSENNVAMVDEDLMVVNTFSFGPTAIYAETLDGKLRSVSVDLEVVHIHEIIVQPQEVKVRAGGRQQLQAICKLANGDVTSDVYLIWTESNSNVARVSAAGMVFGHEPGQTEVYAGDDHCLSRNPASVTVIPVPGTGGSDRAGRGYPKILISEIDSDPETGERVEFSREEPPVWQRAVDVDRNIWWINSASPLARTYLDRERGYGFESREWRIYHLERIIEVMVKIAIVYAAHEGEEMSLENWTGRWDEMASLMQAHAAATLKDFIDEGILPRTGGSHA